MGHTASGSPVVRAGGNMAMCCLWYVSPVLHLDAVVSPWQIPISLVVLDLDLQVSQIFCCGRTKPALPYLSAVCSLWRQEVCGRQEEVEETLGTLLLLCFLEWSGSVL